MAHVVFYEKPGCAGNARQKGCLLAAGHTLEVRDLLATRWTAATLTPFFDRLPPGEWFNRRAPQIRDGAVDPDRCDESAALAAMIASPLLIRRPLLQVGEERRAGFDPEEIDRWIGLSADSPTHEATHPESCPRGPSMPPCPLPPRNRLKPR